MRLLNTRTLEPVEVFGSDIPPYAILSHTWGQEEVCFQELVGDQSVIKKEGYIKIRAACEIAQSQGLSYAWVDTCCIDKSSSAELTEAINSMFQWYKQAEVCYAYLSDVESTPSLSADSSTQFAKSRWFTRGWTLQELIAPRRLIFWSQQWNQIGNREDLASVISDITRIPEKFLRFRTNQDHLLKDLANCSVAQRMSWAAHRETTRVEDQAYSLLGIFNVNMPLLYGEGRYAFKRLQEAIIMLSSDLSVFAWRHQVDTGPHGILAPGPWVFVNSEFFVPANTIGGDSFNTFYITNRGLRITLPTLQGNAILFCQEAGDHTALITLPLAELREGLYARVETDKLGKIYCHDWKHWGQWNWKTLYIVISDAVQWSGPEDWRDIHALPGIHLTGRNPELQTTRSIDPGVSHITSPSSDSQSLLHTPREHMPPGSTRKSNTAAHILTPVGLWRMNDVPMALSRSFIKAFATDGRNPQIPKSSRASLPGIDSASLASYSCSNEYSIEDEFDELLPLEATDELVTYMADQVARQVPRSGSSQNSATTSLESRALNSDAPTSTGHQHTNTTRKRRRLANEDGNGDGGEERDNPLEGPGDQSDKNTGLLMACPYYKWKPLTHKNCQSLVLRGIPRVKYHLWRAHDDIPIHCAVCFDEFPTEGERDSHVRRLGCQLRDRPSWDGMTPEQKRKIKKRVDPRRSKENHWFDIFEILFPGYPLPESPYVELMLCNELATLRDFISHRFGPLLRSRVQEQLPDDLRQHASAIQQLSHSVFEYTLERVLDQFQQQRQSKGSRSSRTSGDQEEAPSSASQPRGNSLQSSNTSMPAEETADSDPAQNAVGEVEADEEAPQDCSNDVDDAAGTLDNPLMGGVLGQYLQDDGYDLGHSFEWL